MTSTATTLKPIKTEADYEAALDRINQLMDAQPDTPEADELEVLALLIEAYEEEQYPISLPDPITAIQFRLEQAGLTPTDLIPHLGSLTAVQAVLAKQQALTLPMIRALHQFLHIPAEILLQDYL